MLQLLPDEEHDLGRGRHGRRPRTPRSRGMVRLLRNQGMEQRTPTRSSGFNTRMTDIHAAIGRVQLAKLAGWTAQRQANAAFLSANLRGRGRRRRWPRARCTSTTSTRSGSPGDRDGFVAALATSTASAPACTTRPRSTAAARSGSTLDLPETAKAAAEVLSLPVHPSLSQERPRADRRGRQRRREGGCLMAEPARRPDRPGHDGPPPRPGAGVASTASTWSRVADPGGDVARACAGGRPGRRRRSRS